MLKGNVIVTLIEHIYIYISNLDFRDHLLIKILYVKAFFFSISIRYLIKYLLFSHSFLGTFSLSKTLEVVLIESQRRSTFPPDRWAHSERTMSKLKAHGEFEKDCFQFNVILKKIGPTLKQNEKKILSI